MRDVESATEMVRVNAPSVVVRRELFGFLSADEGAEVTLLSAPPGSGKTVLLRSWVEDAGLERNVAWVSVEREEQDPQRFWLSVIGRLREAAGAEIIENLEPSPTFDGDALVDRLISELGALEDVVVLVIDDVHELRSPEVLRQLEALLDRRPSLLRVVIAGRRDPRLGLHRLRIAGQLAEIRGADLRFTLEETRELLAATGVVLSDASVARLQDRTEGWAAGLRLAAIALSGHPDPERFVAEFTGSERTVADYLFAEVLVSCLKTPESSTLDIPASFMLMGRFAGTGSSRRPESRDASACSTVIASAAVVVPGPPSLTVRSHRDTSRR